jgi:nucleotide-binding universal stress UspA family protein
MINSIVVGTDGSSTADKAVSEAIQIAKANKAKLHVVTAFEDSSLARKQREADQIPADMQWAFNARDAIDATASHAAQLAESEGIEVQAHVRQSSPAGALIEVAEESGADLIVVGNKGMTGAKRFVASSVPNKVTHHAPCSVLVVQTTV